MEKIIWFYLLSSGVFQNVAVSVETFPYYSVLPHTGTVIFFERFIKIHLKLHDKLTHPKPLGELLIFNWFKSG